MIPIKIPRPSSKTTCLLAMCLLMFIITRFLGAQVLPFHPYLAICAIMVHFWGFWKALALYLFPSAFLVAINYPWIIHTYVQLLDVTFLLSMNLSAPQSEPVDILALEPAIFFLANLTLLFSFVQWSLVFALTVWIYERKHIFSRLG